MMRNQHPLQVHPLAASRMKALLPNVKLVLLLREPVSRAQSAWRMAVERGKEPRSFAQALSQQLEPAARCLAQSVPSVVAGASEAADGRIRCVWTN